eukprot:10289317-Lingulodinium_polyedra.AAC.1
MWHPRYTSNNVASSSSEGAQPADSEGNAADDHLLMSNGVNDSSLIRASTLPSLSTSQAEPSPKESSVASAVCNCRCL